MAPKELVAVIGEEEHRHWGAATFLAFSPDGKYLASGGSGWPFDGVRIWRTSDFREIALLPSGGMSESGVMAIDFFPDGTLLAIQNNGDATAWEIGNDRVKQRQTFKIGDVVRST